HRIARQRRVIHHSRELQTVGYFCALCASACTYPTLLFYVAYHFMAELLLFPVASTFVIIPVTVDCGIFSGKEISWMELLHRWQPITVPRLNSLSS
ncbi:unnamed protein product, partial [Staurois parvus]